MKERERERERKNIFKIDFKQQFHTELQSVAVASQSILICKYHIHTGRTIGHWPLAIGITTSFSNRFLSHFYVGY